MPICDNCGMGLPVGYDYCFKCGYPVRGLPPEGPIVGGVGPAAAQQPPVPDDDGASSLGGPPPFGSPATTGYGVPGAPGYGAPGAHGHGAPAASGYGAPAASARTQVLAGWNSRLVASLIDYMLVSAAVGLVVWLSGAFGGAQGLLSHLGKSSRPMMELEGALMLSFFAYNFVCEAAFHATLGKRVLGLRVVAYGGGSAGAGALLTRNLTKMLSCLVWFVGVPIALFAIATNPDHQRLGDRLARTYVLRDLVTFAPDTLR